MKILFFLIYVTLVDIPGTVQSRVHNDSDHADQTDPLKKLQETVAELVKGAESMKKTMGSMARQMMLQQLFVEERIRSEADSGVKQVRHSREGTRNYYSPSHTSVRSVLVIHDHSNNYRTVGMGEFVAVLNGVEFRTRHNDYRLVMPHTTSSELHAVEDIPFPDVPPEVTSKNSIRAQIKEMRKWFKAWKNQDYSKRDYRKYFKPVLCYLEGAWTTTSGDKLDEPFESDRHFVDASSWLDLQEKIRFTSYAGRKHFLENFSFLPTTIMNVTDDGLPQFAQWNYRILCHPMGRDFPLNRFRVINELGSRISARRTYKEHVNSRSARFQINPFDTDKWTDRLNGRKYGLLDKLMSEIPGKDNYQGNLTDDAFGLPAFSMASRQDNVKLRADRYHRWFKAVKRDAMGLSSQHRGFADENLFMAMNTQPRISGMNLHSCRKNVCKSVNQKWSYAIPLEIIYLTPLSKWNPYDIEYKGDANSTLGLTAEADGRNGGPSLDKAYNGTNRRTFYQTPVEFFSGREVGVTAADTAKDSVGVLDKKGNLRFCKASGTRVIIPSIRGIGSVRQRYPIMPVHGEGSAVWKELEAVKDLLLKSKTNGYLFSEPLQSDKMLSDILRKDIKLLVRRSTASPDPHTHEISLDVHLVEFLRKGQIIEVRTSISSGHDHTMMLKRELRSDKSERFFIFRCDSNDEKRKKCWDKHPDTLRTLFV